jgi:hypothetical protein
MIPDFRGLQNFPEGETRLREIQRQFLESSRSIMFGHELVLDQFGRREMQITQVELYLYCDEWPDENTDRDPEQLNRKTWYVTPDIGDRHYRWLHVREHLLWSSNQTNSGRTRRTGNRSQTDRLWSPRA